MVSVIVKSTPVAVVAVPVAILMVPPFHPQITFVAQAIVGPLPSAAPAAMVKLLGLPRL